MGKLVISFTGGIVEITVAAEFSLLSFVMSVRAAGHVMTQGVNDGPSVYIPLDQILGMVHIVGDPQAAPIMPGGSIQGRPN